MARTSETAVRDIIETDASISIIPFIETATELVTWLDGQDTEGVLTTSMLEKIERWLAAHLYALRDQQYQSRSTGRASAQFQGQTGMRLLSTYYGQTACQLDVTGRLEQLAKGGRKVAKLTWLGKASDSVRPDGQ